MPDIGKFPTKGAMVEEGGAHKSEDCTSAAKYAAPSTPLLVDISSPSLTANTNSQERNQRSRTRGLDKCIRWSQVSYIRGRELGGLTVDELWMLADLAEQKGRIEVTRSGAGRRTLFNAR